jgi:hypothetical protein
MGAVDIVSIGATDISMSIEQYEKGRAIRKDIVIGGPELYVSQH